MSLSLSFLNGLFGVTAIFWMAILLFAIRAKVYSGKPNQQLTAPTISTNTSGPISASTTKNVTRKSFIWANWNSANDFDRTEANPIFSIVTLSLFVMSFLFIASGLFPGALDTILNS